MGTDRYFKCYFSKNGSTKTEVIKAWDEREACNEIEKKYPSCTFIKALRCDEDGDVRNC